MKKQATVERAKQKLFAMNDDASLSLNAREEAYAYATALQWATEKTGWSLMTLVRLTHDAVPDAAGGKEG